MKLLEIYQPYMSAVTLISEGKCQISTDEAMIKAELLRKEAARLVSLLSGVISERGNAEFAVYAWADEMLLLSASVKDLSYKPLQMKFFGTNCAGEEFFTRLEKLLLESSEGQSDSELLNGELLIFGICMAAGFKGCYHDDANRLKKIRQNISNTLAYAPRDETFNTRGVERKIKSQRRGWFINGKIKTALSFSCLITVIIMFLIYQRMLAVDLLNWSV